MSKWRKKSEEQQIYIFTVFLHQRQRTNRIQPIQKWNILKHIYAGPPTNSFSCFSIFHIEWFILCSLETAYMHSYTHSYTATLMSCLGFLQSQFYIDREEKWAKEWDERNMCLLHSCILHSLNEHRICVDKISRYTHISTYTRMHIIIYQINTYIYTR